MKCAYKFIGEQGQRIRLEFRDFDLFYGGAKFFGFYEFFKGGKFRFVPSHPFDLR